jgi:hypothetical protein
VVQDGKGAQWFPQTKLYPPLIRGDHLERPRLLGTIREAVTSRRLTLLSAPAGSGKTTLLAALFHAFPDLPIAWLSLDDEDNDPASFLTALLAAVQQVARTCCINAQTLLASLPDPGANLLRFVGILLNDIVAIFTRVTGRWTFTQDSQTLEVSKERCPLAVEATLGQLGFKALVVDFRSMEGPVQGGGPVLAVPCPGRARPGQDSADP